MPTFCRHGRVLENCSICSKAERTRPGTVSDRDAQRRAAAASTPRTPRPARPQSVAAKRRAQRPGSEMTVRRIARAADDGYANALVPGLRASDDARRLAEELAFAAGRLSVLASDPPGVYGEAAAAGDVEEGLWRVLLVSLVSPGGDLDGVLVPWSSGELPAFGALGPRGADPRKLSDVVVGYRGRAEKAGSQAALLLGEAGWTPQRRFERAYERLALSGFSRAPRYEFLTVAGALGLVAVEASTLALASDALDPVTVAAKRVFGIGDPVLLARRAAELAGAAGVPIAALDLALFNWGSVEERYLAGVGEDALDLDAQVAALAALGVD